MKLLHKLSLRGRLTVLTGIVLISCALSLTFFSIYNAGRTFIPLITEGTPATLATPVDITLMEENSDIVVAMRRVHSIAARRSFNNLSYIILGFFTMVGIAAVYVASGQALKPVKELSREVLKIGEHNLSKRLDIPASKDEIGELTEGFNRMMERLDEAFERQSRFTANAAHELKTPLATIKAGIQVLNMEERPSVEDYKANAQITEQSVERLALVVDDLLTLASQGQEAYEDTTVEMIQLTSMFEAIVDEISPHYLDKDISSLIDCGEHEILGNPALLYHAFFNLIENAYKYNVLNGQVAVRVKTDGTCYKVTIYDTGLGIPQESLSDIFEPFYRVEKSRSRKIAGSGLGLSITKAIIEKHGGSITVESENSVGTTMEVVLPKV